MTTREVEVRAKIPKDLHEKLLEIANNTNDSIKGIVVKAIENYIKGVVMVTDRIVKVKPIIPQFRTRCLLCNNVIDPNEYKSNQLKAVWIQGFGCICNDCIIKLIAQRLSDKDYAKDLLKYEVEIRRLRKLRTDLNKEVNELAKRYYILSNGVRVHEKIDQVIDMIYDYLRIVETSNVQKEALKKITIQLTEIRDELKKIEVPESWLKDIVKEIEREEKIEKVIKEAIPP